MNTYGGVEELMNHKWIGMVLVIFIIVLMNGCVEQTAIEKKNEPSLFIENIVPSIQECKVEYFDRWNSATVYFIGSAIDEDGEVISYHWTVSDGYTSTEPSFVHTFQQSGEYHAELIVVDDDGGINSTDLIVYISNTLNENLMNDQKQIIGFWENLQGERVEFTSNGYIIRLRNETRDRYWFAENGLYIYYISSQETIRHLYYFQGEKNLVFYPSGQYPDSQDRWRRIH